ncbi:MAG: dihydrodipicolinate reductase, partial [Candidatus Tectomicrobia bacterium]|nr:dihydrodipicolinate reductase [Candidatus Tectomicrobia bacterium]
MRVLQIGLGSIGCAVSRLLVQKTGWTIVAAVDADPAKYGRDLGEVIGLGHSLGVTVQGDLSTLQDTDIDLAFLTTVSAFPAVLPTLSTLIQQGIDVVSSTEELFYPYHRYAAQAAALDELAKQHGVSLLGTGINPGFVMDTLVLVLTGACQHITRLAVTRVTNASGARASLQTKLGLGLPPELFAMHATQGQVGDFGLVDSLAFVAHILK